MVNFRIPAWCGAMVLAAGLSTPGLAQEGPVEIGPSERAAIMEAVRNELKDPDSARFRWLPRTSPKRGYCGLVNAKNSFGGYTGYVPFLALVWPTASGPSVTVLDIADADPDSSSSLAILQVCLEDGLDPRLATDR